MDKRISPVDDTGGGLNGEAVERYLSRIAGDYLLRSIEALSKLFDYDILLGLVYLTILQANLSGQVSASEVQAFDGDGAPPDSYRRPVSTLAVANALRLPRETARRYVNRLIERGYCERTADRRLVVPLTTVRRPDILEGLATNRRNLERMVAQLKRVGLY